MAIAPAGVHVLCQAGQQVLIESGAGKGSGIANEEFSQAGAEIVEREEVSSRSDIIVKGKEPLEEEYELLEVTYEEEYEVLEEEYEEEYEVLEEEYDEEYALLEQ